MLSFINFLKSGCFISLALLFGLVAYLQHNIDVMEKEIISLENNITMQKEQYNADVIQDRIDNIFDSLDIPETFIEFEDTNKKDKHEKDTTYINGTYGSFSL